MRMFVCVGLQGFSALYLFFCKSCLSRVFGIFRENFGLFISSIGHFLGFLDFLCLFIGLRERQLSVCGC